MLYFDTKKFIEILKEKYPEAENDLQLAGRFSSDFNIYLKSKLMPAKERVEEGTVYTWIHFYGKGKCPKPRDEVRKDIEEYLGTELSVKEDPDILRIKKKSIDTIKEDGTSLDIIVKIVMSYSSSCAFYCDEMGEEDAYSLFWLELIAEARRKDLKRDQHSQIYENIEKFVSSCMGPDALEMDFWSKFNPRLKYFQSPYELVKYLPSFIELYVSGLSALYIPEYKDIIEREKYFSEQKDLLGPDFDEDLLFEKELKCAIEKAWNA